MLSRAGKEVLLKAVAQAIPTYMMSIFRLPDGLLNEIHSMMAQFWWGSTQNTREIHWHSWSNMCLKKNKGGMGFRDLKCFNQALLAKKIWRLHEQPTSLLAVTLNAKYFKHSGVLDALRGFDPSFSWRSLWGAKSLLLEGLIWRAGNGWNIRTLHDKWITKDGNFISPSLMDAAGGDLLVGDLIDHEQMQWRVDMIRNTFDQSSVEAILSIPLPNRDSEDRLYWWANNNGWYSVRSGYWCALNDPEQVNNTNDGDERALWQKIWRLICPPKLIHFLWRACRNSLPVNAVRKYRHMTLSDLCPRCNEAPESLCHALFDCRTVCAVWTSHPCSRIISAAPRDSDMMIKWLLSHASSEEFEWICASMWASWFGRNKYVMEAVDCNVMQLSISFVEMVKEYKAYTQKIAVSRSPRIISLQKWQPPCNGWVKINFDVHLNTGCTRGLGIAIRNHRGELLLTGT